MDEAERCHRIAYISYGRLIAVGTVDDVVQGSNLVTLVVSGPNPGSLVDRISRLDGVEQVAPFGATLHVVGTDRGRIERALAPIAGMPGYSVAAGQTSLEDVFIKFMGNARDNMD
jgi:ABC-2 type transport system ATP-binding protein